jgi:hypothetical protein
MSLHSWQETAIKHPDAEHRCKALHELAKWGDRSEIMALLRERAAHDDYWRARTISLQLLVDLGDHDLPACEFILERADNDSDSRVRSTAIEIIPEIWPGTAQELSNTLSERAYSSRYADVRHAALLAIYETFRNDSSVLVLIKNRAENDPDPIVRLVAVEALVRDWRNDPDIFSFLCQRAQEDSDPDVRRAANGVTLPTINIFVSYSHKDKQYAKTLVEYISGELKRDSIELWWDERIVTGSLWDKAIRSKIRGSHVALVLVSQSLLNSDYCQKVEIRTFLRQRRSEGMVIFPIVLSACAWQSYDWLSETQVLPTGGKNLKSHYNTTGKREELFYRVLIHLQQVAREIRSDMK